MAAGGNADLINQMEQGAANYLEKVRARLHAGGDVVTAVRLGTAATELEEYISSEKLDLVVMTSHGRSGLVRAALGSVTDRLAGNGTAPVLVVRSPV
jgi:nucleotide-binding universal stress UspA family protein